MYVKFVNVTVNKLLRATEVDLLAFFNDEPYNNYIIIIILQMKYI